MLAQQIKKRQIVVILVRIHQVLVQVIIRILGLSAIAEMEKQVVLVVTKVVLLRIKIIHHLQQIAIKLMGRPYMLHLQGKDII